MYRFVDQLNKKNQSTFLLVSKETSEVLDVSKLPSIFILQMMLASLKILSMHIIMVTLAFSKTAQG